MVELKTKISSKFKQQASLHLSTPEAFVSVAEIAAPLYLLEG